MGNSVNRVPELVVKGALLLGALVCCSHEGSANDQGAGAAAPRRADTVVSKGKATGAATPVRMASITRGTLSVIVSGPGRTDALDVQKVRAPFAGTLESLTVVVGDRVESGQKVGGLINQTSQATLTGAQVMQRDAKTSAERSDANRALELARESLVQTALRAPRAGVVISRGASQGDLVSPGDSIISIASANSIVFIAHIAQSDLARIRPGQRATIDAPGRAVAVEGIVHGFLPADTNAMSVPVRIDLHMSDVAVPTGLFGTAHIFVGERKNVVVVPAAAILRDDVNGTSRIAVVDLEGRARWAEVSVGVQQGTAVEISSPLFAPGARVIISGQVGLPDGSHVIEAPSDSTAIAPERAASAQP
jgi:RND family efflux transporter MFP subunit